MYVISESKIMQMKRNETHKEKETNALSVKYWLSSFFDQGLSLNLCLFAVHHFAFFQEAGVTCPSIQVTKAIAFKHQLLFH